MMTSGGSRGSRMAGSSRMRGTVARFTLLAGTLLVMATTANAAGEAPVLPLPALPPSATGSGAPSQGLLPPQGFSTAPQLDPGQLSFEIPPVFQRPLGIEEGGRVFVKEFIVSGVIDDAEAGILKAEIDERVRQRFEDLNQLLTRLRVERQNQENVGPDGFTPEEREAIIDFMAEVVRELSPDRQVAAYQAFVDQLRLQRLDRNQGLTIGQLQLVADEITRYYREKGFFLARAVIPAQEVVDGVVMIRVLEGRLGAVKSQGNESYSHERLADPFEDYIGELITVDRIEDALLTLQDYPGLSSVGVFQPGETVGTADILVNVSDEDLFDFLVRADNHGTRITGEQRLLGEVTLNNLFGQSDILRLTALQTYEPDNSLFGALKFELPFADPRHRIGAEATRNTFDIGNLTSGGAGNEVGGTSEIASLYYQRNFIRTRAMKVGGKVNLSRKLADTETFGVISDRDEIAVLGIEGTYENIDSASATITSAYARLDVGLDGQLGTPTIDELRDYRTDPAIPDPIRFGRDGTPAGGDFTKLTVGYSWLKSLTVNQTLLMRINGQYTEDLLTSLEQFSIGGPTNVRAIPSSQFLTDSGAFASVEWGIRAPGFSDKRAFANRNWGDLLRFTLFYDYAYGSFVENAVLSVGESETIEAGGAGVGVEFGLPGVFRLNMQWARLTNGVEVERANVMNPRAVTDDDQFWLDLTVEF